jgi:ankyrin repeat protein
LSPERFTAARVTSIPDDNPDIEAFISAELESRIESKKLVIGNPALILEIQDTLLEGSQGMFLWVALQIESLCDMKTDDAIRQALADLPKDLSETFLRILRKSEGSGKPYQKRILELVTVAHRPLTVEELRDALSVVPGDAVWNPSRLLNDIHFILTCCGSLFTVDEEERTIRLVHHSVKQFLLSGFKDSANRAITIDSANKTMAHIIITYLNYGVFETQLSTMVVPQIMTASAPSQVIRSMLDSSSSVQSLALKLLKSRKQPDFDIGKTLAETSNLFSPRSVDKFHFYSYAKQYWLQHIFCISEQEPVMCDLLLRLFKGNIVDTNATDKDGRVPLSLAARNGQETVVKLLLDSGKVDADLKDGEGRTPLSWAAMDGHEAVVNLLLDNGADLESKDRYYSRTPLSWAAGNGHEAVVKLLLDRGAKLESKDIYYWTPLLRAAMDGHETVVNLLLEKGVELGSITINGQTLLSYAAINGHEAVVKLLLDSGKVHADLADRVGMTPLSWAAANGHKAIMNLLLDKGVELESISGTSWTPLLRAASNGHEAAVKLLLDKGAKLESIAINGHTALSCAASKGHEAMVNLLLDNGADLESKDHYYSRTPLSWAAENGYEAVVKLLLDKGAKLESKAFNGQTPLSYATKNRHEAVVKLLQARL